MDGLARIVACLADLIERTRADLDPPEAPNLATVAEKVRAFFALQYANYLLQNRSQRH